VSLNSKYKGPLRTNKIGVLRIGGQVNNLNQLKTVNRLRGKENNFCP